MAQQEWQGEVYAVQKQGPESYNVVFRLDNQGPTPQGHISQFSGTITQAQKKALGIETDKLCRIILIIE